MRLNFSAVSEDDIVEGIRRIGKVIDEQISLYSTFTGRLRQHETPTDTAADPEPQNVVQFPRANYTQRGTKER